MSMHNSMVLARASWEAARRLVDAPLDWQRSCWVAIAAAADGPAAARPWLLAQTLALRGPRLCLELVRVQHAAGVQGGALSPSLLESAAFERRLAWLEQCLLGPWARTR
jgi:hypothetical protein